MNRVILSGRIVRDPDVRYATNNMCVAKYTLATERYAKKGEEKKADFITCVSMGHNAEFAEKYFKKGMKIIVEGKWQTGSYKNRDGITVYTNECFVDRHEIADGKISGQQRETQQMPEPSLGNFEQFVNIPDSIDTELPFT